MIQGFIVDFYCHQAGLVVEVDGDVHDLQKEEDERREKVLSEMGLKFVRYTLQILWMAVSGMDAQST